MKHRVPLDPEVVGIEVVNGHQYSKSRANVKLNVSDHSGERVEINVVYPVQNEHHLTMLMKHTDTGMDVDHPSKRLISDKINELVIKKDE